MPNEVEKITGGIGCARNRRKFGGGIEKDEASAIVIADG